MSLETATVKNARTAAKTANAPLETNVASKNVRFRYPHKRTARMISAKLSSVAIAKLLAAAACQQRQLPQVAAPNAQKIVSVLTAKRVASEENAPFLATPAALLPAAACQPPRFASAENARPAALTVNAL